jgi:hypothetical protein
MASRRRRTATADGERPAGPATQVAGPLLDRRALNRATLARQLLLRRSDLPTPEVVEHLVGVQAQTPHTWYVGLWTRIAGFRPEDAADPLTARRLVRVALMRGTIHLVTAFIGGVGGDAAHVVEHIAAGLRARAGGGLGTTSLRLPVRA